MLFLGKISALFFMSEAQISALFFYERSSSTIDSVCL